MAGAAACPLKYQPLSSQSSIAYVEEGFLVATLTIRNLEDPLKRRLRLRAAAHHRSMEEEARQILRAALQVCAAPAKDLGSRIRARFASLGDVSFALQAREPAQEPPPFESPQAPGRDHPLPSTPRARTLAP